MFNNVQAFALLLIIPVMIALFYWRDRRRMRIIQRIGDASLIEELIAQVNYTNRAWKIGLWFTAVSLLIFALARPVWGIDEDFIEARGVAIMVVMDVSASMDAQDIMPSRLERAKLAARNLFLESTGNQIGLILFAGSAFVQFPMTTDVNSALTFLEAASTDSITRQGTAVEDALWLAIEAFDERTTSDAIIVLMTDGENHQGDPTVPAEFASEQGILIYALGFGTTEGEPIPILDAQGVITGYKSDAAGNLVLSQLDGTTLQEIAEASGGIYQPATDSGIEVVNLLNTVSELEQGILESRRQVRRVERFGLFVGLALIALSAEMLLSDRKISARQDRVTS